jgi:DNA helicase-2/ATP-dependent DNA helicase PcrA
MEEERRLAFVAMTRAEKALYLSEAEGRNLDGSPRYPSRFLLDIDQALLDYTEKPRDSLVAEARGYIASSAGFLASGADLPVYDIGRRVRHDILGVGTIIDLDTDRAAYVVKFDSMDTPRTLSFRVKLEKCE